MGKTKKDRIKNAHIKEELRMEEIQNQTEIDCNSSDMSNNRYIQNTKMITSDEDELIKTQGQTMKTLARKSQERHRKKRTILGEGRGDAGMDR
jgi:hypothetical protein